jgi:hypothetical protein
MMIRAYDHRQNDEWMRTRLSAYVIYCTSVEQKERKDIYDFMPLPGDPTKEERLKTKTSGRQAMIERFKKKGYLK